MRRNRIVLRLWRMKIHRSTRPVLITVSIDIRAIHVNMHCCMLRRWVCLRPLSEDIRKCVAFTISKRFGITFSATEIQMRNEDAFEIESEIRCLFSIDRNFQPLSYIISETRLQPSFVVFLQKYLIWTLNLLHKTSESHLYPFNWQTSCVSSYISGLWLWFQFLFLFSVRCWSLVSLMMTDKGWKFRSIENKHLISLSISTASPFLIFVIHCFKLISNWNSIEHNERDKYTILR